MAQPVRDDDDYEDMSGNVNAPYTREQLQRLSTRQLKGICHEWNIAYYGIQPFLFNNGNQSNRKAPYINAILAHANNNPAPQQPPADPLNLVGQQQHVGQQPNIQPQQPVAPPIDPQVVPQQPAVPAQPVINDNDQNENDDPVI